MKKVTGILLAALFPVGSGISQQISNTDLENWESHTTYEVPDSFWTMDEVIFFGQPMVERSTDASSGGYAALLQTRSDAIPATMTYGRQEVIGSTTHSYGWPFISRPVKLTFRYKFLPEGNDTAMVFVGFSRWTDSSAFVGSGVLQIVTPAEEYTEGEVLIDYALAEDPDTVYLAFICGYGTHMVGTRLFVDDISFEYTTAVVHDAGGLPVDWSLSAYPNPFNPAVTISFTIPYSLPVNLSVFNLLGQEVARLVDGEMEGGTHSVRWDASDFAGGAYFCRLATPASVQTRKIILLR